MKTIKRYIQILTGFHRAHHIYYAYGYKFPFLKLGYFPDISFGKRFGFKRIKGHGIDYHNCTTTGIY